jgi:putative FmdB family regulatory protein
MPTYEYKCPSCDIIYSEIRSMTELQKKTHCDKCPSLLIRDYRISGVGFNGSGFYTTDKKQ